MRFEQTQYKRWDLWLRGSRLARSFVIAFGIYSVVYFFAVAILLAYRNELSVLVQAGLALLLARGLITGLITFLYKKQRPYQLYNFTPVLFSKLFSFESKTPASFPSGHVISMTSLSAVLYAYDPVLGMIGFLFSILAGISRVVMGYHYPIDVISGFVLGTLSGLLILLIK